MRMKRKSVLTVFRFFTLMLFFSSQFIPMTTTSTYNEGLEIVEVVSPLTVVVGEDFDIYVRVKNVGPSSLCILNPGELNFEWSPREYLGFKVCLYPDYPIPPPKELKPGEVMEVHPLCPPSNFLALHPGVVTITLRVDACPGFTPTGRSKCECTANTFSITRTFYLKIIEYSKNVIDVWTDRGGRSENLEGGYYKIGEPITIYISLLSGAELVKYTLERPDGNVVTIYSGPLRAGTYTDRGIIGPPPGMRKIRVEAWATTPTPRIIDYDEVHYWGYADAHFRGQVADIWIPDPKLRDVPTVYVVRVTEVVEGHNIISDGKIIRVYTPPFGPPIGVFCPPGPIIEDDIQIGDTVEVRGSMFYSDSLELVCNNHFMRRHSVVVTVYMTITSTCTTRQIISTTITIPIETVTSWIYLTTTELVKRVITVHTETFENMHTITTTTTKTYQHLVTSTIPVTTTTTKYITRTLTWTTTVTHVFTTTTTIFQTMTIGAVAFVGIKRLLAHRKGRKTW